MPLPDAGILPMHVAQKCAAVLGERHASKQKTYSVPRVSQFARHALMSYAPDREKKSPAEAGPVIGSGSRRPHWAGASAGWSAASPWSAAAGSVACGCV